MPMKTKKITMQDIAERLNISKNAVSLALNGKPGVSEETRELIVSLAHKLGYRIPDSNDIIISNNLLVMIPEYIRDDRYFYNDIYWSVENHSTKMGYNAVMTIVTPEMEQKKLLPKLCSEIQFAGILLIGVLQEDYVHFLWERYRTILSVDQNYYALPIPCVLTANIDGAAMLTKKVISRGHRKIGFIGSTSMTTSIYERWCGFCFAMWESGLPVDEELCIRQDSPLTVLLSNSEELAAFFRTMPTLPSAFICGGDRIAIACINALQSTGYRVPEDISVVGFDDIEIGQYISPELTTVHVKRHHMGKTAVAELIKMTRKQHYSQITSLYPELVMRKSLGPCSTTNLLPHETKDAAMSTQKNN